MTDEQFKQEQEIAVHDGYKWGMEKATKAFRAEIERRLARYGRNSQMEELLSFLATLPALSSVPAAESRANGETKSEDLDRAATDYADRQLSIIDKELSETAYARHTKMGIRVFCGSDIEEAFDAGARWQREQTAMLDMFREGSKWKEQQMMKDAINCTIEFRFHRLSIDLKDNNIKGLECGDKVKLIVIRDTPEYTEGVTGHYTTTTK